MGKVVMGFEPREAKLIQAFLKVNQQFDKVKDKARQTNQQTKQSQSAFSELGSTITSQIGSMAAGFASIGQLLSEAQKAWAAWNTEIERTGNTLADFTNNLKAATTGRGDPYSVVRPELLSIAGETGLNRQEIIDLYGAVGNALPFGASTQQIMSLVRETATAKPSLGGQDLPLLGTIAGVISKTAMQPGQFSEEQIANVAFSALQNLGGRAAKATRPGFQRGLGALAAMGITGTEAVSMGVAAQFAGESGELFEKIAVMAIEKRETLSLPPAPLGEVEDPKTTARRALRDRYKNMTPADFTRNVLNDEEAMREFFPGSSFRVSQFAKAYDNLGPALAHAMDADAIDAQWKTLTDLPGNEIERAWELERIRSAMTITPLTGGIGSQMSEARNLWLTKEEARLDSLVQRGEMSPYAKDVHMRGLRVGLASGAYDAELYEILGTEAPNSRQSQIRRQQEATQAANLGMLESALASRGFDVGGAVAPDLNTESAKTADNFRRMNNEVDRAKDEAKAVDVDDRE